MRLRLSPILFALIVILLGATWSLCLGEVGPPDGPLLGAATANGPAAPAPAAPAATPDVAPATKEEDPAAPVAVVVGAALVPKPFGQIAYEAYAASTGWKSAVSGAPLPTWAAQADVIKAAWDAAVKPLVDRLIAAHEDADVALKVAAASHAAAIDAAVKAEKAKSDADNGELREEIRRLKGALDVRAS